MTRICKSCKKHLSSECDYCGSLNVRESRVHPGTLNCGNCHRSGMPIGKPELGECLECELLARRAHQRQRGDA